MSEPIVTTEMHTGGEPVRIIESGYPRLTGATILDKRREAREHHDHLRTMLMHEPRGHFDMYGVIPVEPDDPDADLAVLFIHNEGYSTMCGHATIALGRYAVDRGLVEAVEPMTEFVLQCPCGRVSVRAQVSDGKAGAVEFDSVPAFAFALDCTIDVPGYGDVRYDVGYGGAFYAIAAASEFGLDVRTTSASDLARAGSALSAAVSAVQALEHPEGGDLAFLYGSILTDGDEASDPSANVCVFADSQIDRSPTGSGVTARMAVRHARGAVAVGEVRTFESITGSRMTGSVVSEDRWMDRDAVTVRVGGQAHYTGRAEFIVEHDDELRRGFLLR